MNDLSINLSDYFIACSAVTQTIRSGEEQEKQPLITSPCQTNSEEEISQRNCCTLIKQRCLSSINPQNTYFIRATSFKLVFIAFQLSKILN
jgi:hypothetical protein